MRRKKKTRKKKRKKYEHNKQNKIVGSLLWPRKLFFFRLDTEETKGKQKSGMSRSQKKNGVLACRFLELHPGKDEIPITVDGLRSCRDDKGEQFVPQFQELQKRVPLA